MSIPAITAILLLLGSWLIIECVRAWQGAQFEKELFARVDRLNTAEQLLASAHSRAAVPRIGREVDHAAVIRAALTEIRDAGGDWREALALWSSGEL
jgi:hypothetical protein